MASINRPAASSGSLRTRIGSFFCGSYRFFVVRRNKKVPFTPTPFKRSNVCIGTSLLFYLSISQNSSVYKEA